MNEVITSDLVLKKDSMRKQKHAHLIFTRLFLFCFFLSCFYFGHPSRFHLSSCPALASSNKPIAGVRPSGEKKTKESR